jgi:hypothetical protein
MLSFLIALVLAAPAPQGLRMTGVVENADGPLAGATVYVSRARPRRGVGIL